MSDRLSVVILSRNARNLGPCLDALAHCEPLADPIVVDDGLPEGWCDGRGVQRVVGAKPFVFARNANLGIQAAGERDVMLLNDDALVMTRGGVGRMWVTALRSETAGVLAALTNVSGYRDQTVARHPVADRVSAGVWPTPVVAFLAVVIPRRVIDCVGLLDERFDCYGGEDRDYCRRVREAALLVGVYDGCYVDHGSLQSTFRPDGGGGDIVRGLELLREKWGDECLR